MCLPRGGDESCCKEMYIRVYMEHVDCKQSMRNQPTVLCCIIKTVLSTTDGLEVRPKSSDSDGEIQGGSWHNEHGL